MKTESQHKVKNILKIGAFFVSKALYILDRIATEKANAERGMAMDGQTIIVVGNTPDGSSKYQDLSTYVEEPHDGFVPPAVPSPGDGITIPPSVMDAPTGPTDQKDITGPTGPAGGPSTGNQQDFLNKITGPTGPPPGTGVPTTPKGNVEGTPKTSKTTKKSSAPKRSSKRLRKSK